MRLLFQLGLSLTAGLVSAFCIVQFQLHENPPLLVALLLVACCLGPLAGLLGTASEVAMGDSSPWEEGEIKWFNVSKGFGFIRRQSGEEVFVHFRSLRGPNPDRRMLKDGQRVSFVVRESEKGPQAEEVEPLS